MYNFQNIDQDDPDGKHPTWIHYYLDRLIAHEFTHATMNAKVNNFSELPGFIKEGMAELTTGIDDSQYSRITSAVKTKDTLSKYVDNVNDSLAAEDYVGGYILLRYLARQFGDLNISNSDSRTLVSGFYGNDSIYNSSGANYVTIEGGEGKDTLYNFQGNYAYMIGGQGDDSIYNNSYYSTVNGGDGNDTIIDYDVKKTSIDGGAGNDIVSLSGTNFGEITIKGGTGNDSITLSGGNNLVQYASGDGYDTITGISASDTIKITGAQYEKVTTSSSNDVTLKVGNGSMLIKNGKNVSFTIDGTVKPVSKVIEGTSKSETLFNVNDGYTINGGDGNDTIYSGGKNIFINTGTGNNIVELFKDPVSENVTVTGGSGNDTINSAGKNVNVNAGEGNNYILLYNQAQNNSIKTGSGKDTFEIYGSNNTITAGKGNDSIYLSSPAKNNFIVYNSGDGNDTITGIAANDKIKITGAQYEKVTLSNSNDVTLKVGSGSMLIKNGKNIAFTIDGTPKPVSNAISLTSGNNTYTNTSSGKIIYALAGNDKVTNSASNVTIDGGAGKDTIENKGAGNVIIKGENDADSITSYGNNITIDGGAGNNYVLLYNDSSNVSVKTDSGKDTIYSGGKKIKINSGTGNDYVYLYTASSNVSVDAGNGNDTIYGGGQNISIDGGAGNDYIQLFISSDDVTVKAGKGNDIIRSYSTLGNIFQYSNGDGKDVIYNFSDNDTLQISGTSSTLTSGNDTVIKVGSGSITLKNYLVPNPTPTLPSGWKYGTSSKSNSTSTIITASVATAETTIDLTQNYGEKVLKVDGSKVTKSLTVTGNSLNNTLTGGKGADTIYGNAGNDKISGGTGADLLYGGDGNDSLNGGDGADFLIGGAGTNTLTGGKGNDIFD